MTPDGLASTGGEEAGMLVESARSSSAWRARGLGQGRSSAAKESYSLLTMTISRRGAIGLRNRHPSQTHRRSAGDGATARAACLHGVLGSDM